MIVEDTNSVAMIAEDIAEDTNSGNADEGSQLYRNALQVLTDSKCMPLDDNVMEKMIDLPELLHLVGRYAFVSVRGLYRLTRALPISSLFPFLYFMIRDFHIAEKEEDIGYYAGYVAAAAFVLYVIKFPEPFSMTRHMHVKFSTRNTKL
ncbi:putative peptide/nitrate transporter [Camellia lanceoleosa]|uniref:Peptide/nitrate transporter n=1 Tax=Camellia lanceoleosa TaxID=1840588 RepID=A0ACC0I7L4_9ERIC|nr:putative peptide/nitrate transporter [Camellia lanceoleosa]